MSRQIVLLCIFAALSWSVVSAHVLVPPKGYSASFSGTIQNGVQKYVCNHGFWTKTGSTATIYTPAGVKLGTYWSVYDPKERSITYFWNIVNSGGGSYESGTPISGLQASPLKTVQVSPSAVASYLALVKVHRGAGDADQVAFVSLTATTGGLPPSKALCSSDGAVSGVPFGGKFTFYTQDRVPPTVPVSLTPPGTFVQTVFLTGKRMYRFHSNKWKYIGFFATMAEVAGGKALGKVGTCTKPDKYGSNLSWHFTAPNAYTLNGYATKSVRMYADGCPWQLLKITSQAGYQSPLGKYKYALIGATYGGNPPTIAARVNGLEWGSIFTGQCYLYI